jgi:hypothetical protein
MGKIVVKQYQIQWGGWNMYVNHLHQQPRVTCSILTTKSCNIKETKNNLPTYICLWNSITSFLLGFMNFQFPMF